MFQFTFSKIVSLFSIALSAISFAALQKTIRDTKQIRAELGQAQFIVPESSNWPFISVIVPARNEQNQIEDCITSIAEQDYPVFEVIAVNDNSTDRTGNLLEQLAARYPNHLKVVASSPPTQNWLGKTNALWQGYQQTYPSSEWLLFVDADTRLRPGALRAASGYSQQKKLDLLSLYPKLEAKNLLAFIMGAELVKFYNFASANPFHPAKSGSVEEAVAMGPFILVRRQPYVDVDGHRAVKNEVVEDIALARLLRANGFSTTLVSGFGLVEMTPYENFSEMWESVSKNLFLVAHKSWASLFYVAGIELIYGIVPQLTLASRFVKLVLRDKDRTSRLDWILNVGAVVLVFGLHGKFNRYFEIPVRFALFYPFAAIVAVAMMLNSAYRVAFRKSVQWKNRKIKL